MTTGVAQKKRLKDDKYVTPTWAIDAMMPVVKRLCRIGKDRHLNLLDPGAGTGNIGRALRLAFGPMRVNLWIEGIEKRKITGMKARAPYTVYRDGMDFLEWTAIQDEFDLTMMNPPYRHAQEFVMHALELSRIVVAILRLDFLAGQGRADWFQENAPDIYVLPKRPSFTKDGQTDWYSYGWFVWRAGGNRYQPTLHWLKVP